MHEWGQSDDGFFKTDVAGRDQQGAGNDAEWDDAKSHRDLARDQWRGLRIDTDLVQIDALELFGALPAPGSPDVLGPAQAHRYGRLSEAQLRRTLLLEDLIDVVPAQRDEPPQ